MVKWWSFICVRNYFNWNFSKIALNRLMRLQWLRIDKKTSCMWNVQCIVCYCLRVYRKEAKIVSTQMFTQKSILSFCYLFFFSTSFCLLMKSKSLEHCWSFITAKNKTMKTGALRTAQVTNLMNRRFQVAKKRLFPVLILN